MKKGLTALFFWTFMLSACCSEIFITPPDVDVAPLQDLTLPSDIDQVTDIVDPGVFDRYEVDNSGIFLRGEWVNELKSDFAGISVSIDIFPDTFSAQEEYNYECNRWGRPYKTGGEEDNLSCISYIQRFRLPLDSFCQPTNNYSSFVVFRKGKMVIVVQDDIANIDYTRLSRVIDFLAGEIEENLPH